MVIARERDGGFWWELVSHEILRCSLRWCKREVWEKSVARVMASYMSLTNDKIHENWWTSLKFNEIQWKWVKIRRHQCKSQKIHENLLKKWCAQRKIKHLAWVRFPNSGAAVVLEIKTFLNLGGPAGGLGSWKAATLAWNHYTWLVETAYCLG